MIAGLQADQIIAHTATVVVQHLKLSDPLQSELTQSTLERKTESNNSRLTHETCTPMTAKSTDFVPLSVEGTALVWQYAAEMHKFLHEDPKTRLPQAAFRALQNLPNKFQVPCFL